MNLKIHKYLYDIIHAAKDIMSYIEDMDFHDFQTDGMIQAAVERKFEIIGEALNRIKQANPEILEDVPHHQRIIGLRNIIAHGYDTVDIEILWNISKDHLPALIENANQLLNDQDSE